MWLCRSAKPLIKLVVSLQQAVLAYAIASVITRWGSQYLMLTSVELTSRAMQEWPLPQRRSLGCGMGNISIFSTSGIACDQVSIVKVTRPIDPRGIIDVCLRPNIPTLFK